MQDFARGGVVYRKCDVAGLCMATRGNYGFIVCEYGFGIPNPTIVIDLSSDLASSVKHHELLANARHERGPIARPSDSHWLIGHLYLFFKRHVRHPGSRRGLDM